jgi:hypothetical protein
MKELNLIDFENVNITPLTIDDTMYIEGGVNWSKIWKYVDKGLTYVGYYDAVNDAYDGFIAGYNSK